VDPNARTAAEVRRQLRDARDAYAASLAAWDVLQSKQDPPATAQELAAQRQVVATAKAAVEVLEKVVSRSAEADQ
jgi:hypothetical protein